MILLVRHTRSEMCDSLFGLFRVPQISERNQDVPHRQHTQASQLFGCVEDDGRESAGHFGIESDFDSGLYFVLRLDEQVKHFLCVYDCLPKVGHEADQRCVPLVGDFGKSSRAAGHQYLSNPIFEPFQGLLIDPDKGTGSDLFCDLIL